MFRAQVEDSAQTVCCDSHDDRGTNAEGKDEKRGYQFGAWAERPRSFALYGLSARSLL